MSRKSDEGSVTRTKRSAERAGANEVGAVMVHSIGKHRQLGLSESDGEPLKLSSRRVTLICVKF